VARELAEALGMSYAFGVSYLALAVALGILPAFARRDWPTPLFAIAPLALALLALPFLRSERPFAALLGASLGEVEAAREHDRHRDERNLEMVLRYGNALEDARSRHDGLTLTYEQLTADPEAVTRRACEFLGVAWEPSMLDYGAHDHGRFRAGLGDWSDKIKSGRIQAPEPLPDPREIPEALRPLSAAWGYLPDGS